jgi:hypothetical protein
MRRIYFIIAGLIVGTMLSAQSLNLSSEESEIVRILNLEKQMQTDKLLHGQPADKKNEMKHRKSFGVVLPALKSIRSSAEEVPWPDSTRTFFPDGTVKSKTIYVYNSFGKQTLQQTCDRDKEKNVWVNNYKKETTYNANGDMTLSVAQNWDKEKEEWINESKTVAEYDANGYETLYASYKWDKDKDGWIGTWRKYTNKYNNDGKRLLSESYQWNPDKDDWEEYEKSVWQYDANGYEILSESYIWDALKGSWIGSGRKYVQTYNSNGLCILEISYRWDNIKNNWVGSNKSVYDYDNMGRQTLSESYVWDAGRNDWTGTGTKYVSAYDVNGYSILSESYSWNYTVNAWTGNYKYVYENDSNGNTIWNETYNWENNTWIRSGKWIYERDINGYTIVSEYHYWENNAWAKSHKWVYARDAGGNISIETLYSWDAQNNSWGNGTLYRDMPLITDAYYSEGALIKALITERQCWDESARNWVFNYYELDFDSPGFYFGSLPYYNYQIEKDYRGNLKTFRAYNWNDDIGFQADCNYDSNGYPILCQTFYLGSNQSRTVYAYDAYGNQTLREPYHWDSNRGTWVVGGYYNWDTTKDEYAYDKNGNRILLAEYDANTGNNTWVGRYKYGYAFDDAGNQTSFESYSWDGSAREWMGDNKYSQTFNDKKEVTSYVTYNWNFGTKDWAYRSKNNYAYDEDKNIILDEYYTWDNETGDWLGHSKTNRVYEDYNLISNELYNWDSTEKEWVGEDRTDYAYNKDGKETSLEKYDWVNESKSWIKSTKDVYVFDNSGNKTMYQTYAWADSKWGFESYTIYYPNSNTSELEAIEIQPVSTDNKGNFEIGLTLPTEASLTGSFLISFPEGITLDEEQTALSMELSDNFELIITPKENNSWLVEIRTKELKSTAENTYQKILNIAYKTDENLPMGEYEIRLNNLNFELNDGTRIIEESLAVPVSIERYPAGIEEIDLSGVHVFANNNVLTIKSLVNERVEVYTLTGIKLRSIEKEPGIVRISNISQDIVIVKGSSGWSRKIIVN